MLWDRADWHIALHGIDAEVVLDSVKPVDKALQGIDFYTLPGNKGYPFRSGDGAYTLTTADEVAYRLVSSGYSRMYNLGYQTDIPDASGKLAYLCERLKINKKTFICCVANKDSQEYDTPEVYAQKILEYAGKGFATFEIDNEPYKGEWGGSGYWTYDHNGETGWLEWAEGTAEIVKKERPDVNLLLNLFRPDRQFFSHYISQNCSRKLWSGFVMHSYNKYNVLYNLSITDVAVSRVRFFFHLIADNPDYYWLPVYISEWGNGAYDTTPGERTDDYHPRNGNIESCLVATHFLMLLNELDKVRFAGHWYFFNPKYSSPYYGYQIPPGWFFYSPGDRTIRGMLWYLFRYLKVFMSGTLLSMGGHTKFHGNYPGIVAQAYRMADGTISIIVANPFETVQGARFRFPVPVSLALATTMKGTREEDPFVTNISDFVKRNRVGVRKSRRIVELDLPALSVTFLRLRL